MVLSTLVNIITLVYVSRMDRTRLSDRIQAIAFVNRIRAERQTGTQSQRKLSRK